MDVIVFTFDNSALIARSDRARRVIARRGETSRGSESSADVRYHAREWPNKEREKERERGRRKRSRKIIASINNFRDGTDIATTPPRRAINNNDEAKSSTAAIGEKALRQL